MPRVARHLRCCVLVGYVSRSSRNVCNTSGIGTFSLQSSNDGARRRSACGD